EALGVIVVATQSNPVTPSQFELFYAKGLAAQTPPARSSLPAPPGRKPLLNPRPVTFTLDLSLAHIDYTVVAGTSGVPPSEYNLELSARNESAPFGSSAPLELEAALPVVSL